MPGEGPVHGAEQLPVDGSLPLLGALAQDGAETILGRLGLAPRGALRVLGHHPGKRVTLGDGGDLVVKGYASDPRTLVELLEALGRAGLTGPEPPLATAMLAYDPQLHVVVTPRLPGPSLRDVLRAGDAERVGTQAAAWLRAVARAPVAQGPDRGPRALLEDADTWASEIDDSALRAQALDVMARLAGSPPDEGPRALVHCSYRPQHVIDLPGGPGVYDWDGYGQGRLELDAGHFLVVMDRGTKGRPDRVANAARAGAALREAIADVTDADAVEWHRALMLVKHSWRMSRTATPDWRVRAAAFLDEARAVAA